MKPFRFGVQVGGSFTPEAFATIRPGAAAVPPGELGPASATPANNIASAAASRVRLAAEFTFVI